MGFQNNSRKLKRTEGNWKKWSKFIQQKFKKEVYGFKKMKKELKKIQAK